MRQRSKPEAGSVVYEAVLRTPLGPMRAGCTARGVCMLRFPDEAEQVLDGLASGTQEVSIEHDDERFAVPAARRHMQQVAEWLTGFFKGENVDLPALDLSGCAPFGERVLRATAGIAAGQTVSYGQVAALAGNARAARAVGGAMNHNPLVLLVPCHRVVGAARRDGTAPLVGFGAGLALKQALLDFESRWACNGVGRSDKERYPALTRDMK